MPAPIWIPGWCAGRRPHKPTSTRQTRLSGAAAQNVSDDVRRTCLIRWNALGPDCFEAGFATDGGNLTLRPLQHRPASDFFLLICLTSDGDIESLNRDNVRLTEQANQHDREVRELRAQTRRLDEEVQALRPVARECDALQIRCAQEQLAGEGLRADVAAAREALLTEQAARQAAETTAAHATARAQAFEDLLARRETISHDVTPPSMSAAPSASTSLGDS